MSMQNNYSSTDFIDLKTIPFSRFGSFFVISAYDKEGTATIYIRDVRGGDLSPGLLFSVEILSETESAEDLNILCTETMLTIKSLSGILEIFFSDEDTLRMRGNGLSLSLNYLLKKYDNILQETHDKWELCSYSKELRVLVENISGDIKIDAPWDTVGNRSIKIMCDGASEPFDLSLESYKVVPKKRTSEKLTFYEAHEIVKREYEDWFSKLPEVAEKYEEKKKLASYITWMNFVKPEGHLKSYAMYMSKNWMTNIWSWDNCFGAIFLAGIDAELSYDQFMMFKDHQHECGMYPDYVNDTYVSFSCTKPPIYGWCYDYLLRKNDYFADKTKIGEVYDTISKQTNFYLNFRLGELGLPYYKHGNDSGWDNGTSFAHGIPVITPDLSALLIYQMDFLSGLADKLGLHAEKESWTTKADDLTDKLINNLWKDDEFLAYSIAEKMFIESGDSLQLLLPLIIAYRFERSITDKLMKALKDEKRFYGRYGLATEAMNSPFYKDNGYWRGPVWAPTMLMFVESIHRLGDRDTARDLSERFVEAILIGGMAENFDPNTGEGLVDPAFAWTSSVYFTLLEDYIL